MRTLSLLCCLGLFYICTAQQPDLDLEIFATGLNNPTTISNAGDDRLFVTEQNGFIKIINSNGTINTQAFLDVSSKITTERNEQGLLGLAFHPNYSENGYFYINYTNTSGDTVISRFTRSTTTSANPDSELTLLTFDQPFSNHNGGSLVFGPDGMLYIGSGDGGSGGDPQNNSQDTSKLLGKMLRLDVNIPPPYIPQDNPFVNKNGRDEIWAYGLRNPWKFSFDGTDLWIADVGDNATNGDEEINKVINNPKGLNYGWRCYEGNNTTGNQNECNGLSLIKPLSTYDRGGDPYRCSVTGGFVYRGSDYPNMIGQYVFADYCSQELLITPSNGNGTIKSFGPYSVNITTFGIDRNSELYAAGRENGVSKIYRIIDTNALSIDSFHKNDSVIFPNPSKGFFELKSDNQLKDLRLFNIKGELVKEFQFQPNNLYNIQHLPKGLYLLKITDQNNRKFHQKLQINN